MLLLLFLIIIIIFVLFYFIENFNIARSSANPTLYLISKKEIFVIYIYIRKRVDRCCYCETQFLESIDRSNTISFFVINYYWFASKNLDRIYWPSQWTWLQIILFSIILNANVRWIFITFYVKILTLSIDLFTPIFFVINY